MSHARVDRRRAAQTYLVQQRRPDGPGGAQLVAAHKVLLVAADCIQDETGVGVGDEDGGETLAIVQVQLGDYGIVHVQAWVKGGGQIWVGINSNVAPAPATRPAKQEAPA